MPLPTTFPFFFRSAELDFPRACDPERRAEEKAVVLPGQAAVLLIAGLELHSVPALVFPA